MFCQNPYITFLKDGGYNLLRLPKSDFPPLMLLAREGERDLNRMGHIKELLVGAETPAVQTDVQAAGISGRHTNTLSLSLGLDLLGTILGAMGGGQVGLNTEFKNVQGLSFEFPSVLSDRVDVIALDKYLVKAQVTQDARYVSQLLNVDELYVVTDVIKSKKFTIGTSGNDSVSANVSVPAVQQIVGAKVKVSGESEQSARVSFEGDVPLVFGFQARRLIYDGGSYLRVEPVPPGSRAAKSEDDILAGKLAEPNMLIVKGPWVNLK